MVFTVHASLARLSSGRWIQARQYVTLSSSSMQCMWGQRDYALAVFWGKISIIIAAFLSFWCLLHFGFHIDRLRLFVDCQLTLVGYWWVCLLKWGNYFFAEVPLNSAVALQELLLGDVAVGALNYCAVIVQFVTIFSVSVGVHEYVYGRKVRQQRAWTWGPATWTSV
jgi:hypothetical protein